MAADKGEFLTLRLLQEAVVGHHPGEHRAVDAPRLQVTHHAIGPLVGHNVYPLRPPVLVNIRLLRRALLHADGFALQLFRRIALQGIFTRHEEHRPVIQLVAKGNLRFALLGHVHPGKDRVEFTRLQRRDNAVEIAFHPHAFRLQLLTNGVA
ncbi:osmosensitive K+ channel histidine kinase KdpD [Klebsiella pneumoniae]|nr:osmosensitive K+ channel histidine kinase KdpD [Klebsiella pneumoniae]